MPEELSAKKVMEIEDARLLRTYQKVGIVAVRGEGAYIWDLKGRKLLDFMGGFGVALLGHSRKEIVEAVKKQAEKLIICHNTLYNPARAQLLDRLFDVAPKKMARAYLANSGAEAIEAAIKVAVKASGRSLLLAAKGSYHGKTLGALALTWSSKYRAPFSKLLPKVEFVEYGDPKALENVPFEDAAAFFVEPVQGESGVRIPDPRYLPEAERRCRKAGCLLVVDEIQTGLGRTGRMWAHEHWSVKPDIMTIGKGVAGGIPMGITLVSSEYADVLRLGEQTSTFGGNPLASAAASEVLRILKEEKLPDKAANKGRKLLSALSSLMGKTRIPVAARGIGLMAALDIRLRVSEVLPRLADNGLLALYSGQRTLRFLPPLIVTDKDIEYSSTILEQTFTIIEEEKRKAVYEKL